MTNFVDLLRSVNTMIGNDALAIIFMIMVFFITYISSSTRLEAMKALAFSCWVCTITAIFTRIIFATSDFLVVIFLIISAVATLMIKKENE